MVKLNVIVAPEARGQGYGKALVHEAVRRLLDEPDRHIGRIVAHCATDMRPISRILMSIPGTTCYKLGREYTVLPVVEDMGGGAATGAHGVEQDGPAQPLRKRQARRSGNDADGDGWGDDDRADDVLDGWHWPHDRHALPPIHAKNSAVAVVKGDADDDYVVDLLRYAYQTAAKRANVKERSKVEAAVVDYRSRTADLMALRVVRGDLSLTRVRTFISESRQQQLNHLMEYRLLPTLEEVSSAVKAILEAAASLGVRSIEGINGEGGYWSVRNVLTHVLTHAQLQPLLQPPTRTDCFALRVDGEFFSRISFLETGEMMDEEAMPKTQQIRMLLRHLGLLDFCHADNSISELSACGKYTVILFNVDRTLVDRVVNQRNEIEHSTVMETCDVLDLIMRCMIDAGARIGRTINGITGQTIELLSFKHMRGLAENLICNAFPVLAYTGSDSHQNYNSYCNLLRDGGASEK